MTSVRVFLICLNETSTICALNTASKDFRQCILPHDTIFYLESWMNFRHFGLGISLTRYACAHYILHKFRHDFLKAKLSFGTKRCLGPTVSSELEPKLSATSPFPILPHELFG